MARLRTPLIIASLGALLMLGLARLGTQARPPVFPPLADSLNSVTTQLGDFVALALGYRRLAADIAWIQTLIYYGTHEADEEDGESQDDGHGHGHAHANFGGGHYPLFLAYCQRVTALDPHFVYAYYFGGSVLGWNLERLDEAETLLRAGIQAHPQQWRLHQFLAALAFQRDHDVNKLTEFLQAFSRDPECPNILRSILANIYKKQKKYREAIAVWTLVYETGDPHYTERAISQIKALYPLATGRK